MKCFVVDRQSVPPQSLESCQAQIPCKAVGGQNMPLEIVELLKQEEFSSVNEASIHWSREGHVNVPLASFVSPWRPVVTYFTNGPA